MNHSQQFLSEARQIIDQIDPDITERMVSLIDQTRQLQGRLFILGVGGSAANASHAVNDSAWAVAVLRKMSARTSSQPFSLHLKSAPRLSELWAGMAAIQPRSQTPA